MDERLRGKGNYSVTEIMDYSSQKDSWLHLESKLSEDYQIVKIIINDSKLHGWGINYRVGNNSLCYIHPEKKLCSSPFKLRKMQLKKLNLT